MRAENSVSIDFFLFIYLFFLSSGGWVKVKLKHRNVLVFVWVVEIGLISVLEIDFDLIPV